MRWTWRGKFLEISSSVRYSPSPCPVGSRGGRESSRRQGRDTTRDTSTLIMSSWNMSCRGGNPKVLRVRDILAWIRIFGSVTLTNGSTDADPEVPRTYIRNTGTFTSFFKDKIKSKKKSQNSRNQGFSYYFCLMMEGAGSVFVTTDPDADPGGPKNIRVRIWIRNTGEKTTLTF
jgi:hypothetical protein